MVTFNKDDGVLTFNPNKISADLAKKGSFTLKLELSDEKETTQTVDYSVAIEI